MELPQDECKISAQVQWKWRSSNNEWISYHEDVNKQIEHAWENYKHTRISDLCIDAYVIDFTTFDQINNVTGYMRSISRVIGDDPTNTNSADVYYNNPGTASQENVESFLSYTASNHDYFTIPISDGCGHQIMPAKWWTEHRDTPTYENMHVGSPEFIKITSMFAELGGGVCKVRRIERIKNPHLAREHRHCAAQMMARPNIVGDCCNSMLLWHGSSNTDAICTQGFDPRVSGVNGDVFGKGIYFAQSPCVADRFAKPNGASTTRHLLLCSVHLGWWATGSRGMVRPPPVDCEYPNGRLYDSVVDDVITPSIYVVFNSGQAYPLYRVTYSICGIERNARMPLIISDDDSLDGCYCRGTVKGREGLIRCCACRVVLHSSCCTGVDFCKDAFSRYKRDYICTQCLWMLRMNGMLGGLPPVYFGDNTELFAACYEEFMANYGDTAAARREGLCVFNQIMPEIDEIMRLLSYDGSTCKVLVPDVRHISNSVRIDVVANRLNDPGNARMAVSVTAGDVSIIFANISDDPESSVEDRMKAQMDKLIPRLVQPHNIKNIVLAWFSIVRDVFSFGDVGAEVPLPQLIPQDLNLNAE